MAGRAEQHPPRPLGTEGDVERIISGLLARDLPRPSWTHEAHLAAVSGILLCRPDIQPERDLPHIISRYNASVGGVNDDKQGYHETITQFWIQVARNFHADSRGTLLERTNQFILADPEGRRDYPLQFWSHALLFSVAARRGWVEPDRMRFARG